MSAREPGSPRQAPARAMTVASFYAAVFVVGFFWHALAQDSNDFWRHDSDQSWLTLLWTPALGVIGGLVVVQVFRALEIRMAWLNDLHHEFRSMFGRPTIGELVVLAFASAVGEEVLFRGAMLDAWGIWVSSLIFALLHIPVKPTLWPWTISACVLGLLLAAMTIATGNLGAAVAAHFVINLQNLAYITRHRPRPSLPGKIAPIKP